MTRPPRRRARRGVTMIELMVSLGIVAIGIIALASGATLVTRLNGGGTIQMRAAMTATDHIERLRARSCASVANGQDTVRGIVSRWTRSDITISSTRRGMAINLVVQYPTSRGTRSQTYRTVLTC